LQYQEELCDLSEVAGLRPQRALVASIQQENRQLRELQQENRELRALLEEHQNALELIMSKYRQHISQLVKNSQIDFEKLAKKELAQVRHSLNSFCQFVILYFFFRKLLSRPIK
jgi:post-segregation antitoxin (ccd killing protein)